MGPERMKRVHLAFRAYVKSENHWLFSGRFLAVVDPFCGFNGKSPVSPKVKVQGSNQAYKIRVPLSQPAKNGTALNQPT